MAAVVVALPAASAGAASSEADQLIVADPLPGYVLAEGGSLNGPIDVGTLMQLEGTESADVPDVFHEFAGYARTWRNDDGSAAVVLVIDCHDQHSATDFLRGALRGQSDTDAESFDSELAGSAGFGLDQDDLGMHVVIWRQDKYFVQVFVATKAASPTETDAKTLAASQAAFLRSSLGAEPSISGARGANDPDESGAAYRVGRVMGALLIPGIVTLVLVGRQRRRAEQSAHEALFSTPPPMFQRRSELPPPTLPPSG